MRRYKSGRRLRVWMTRRAQAGLPRSVARASRVVCEDRLRCLVLVDMPRTHYNRLWDLEEDNLVTDVAPRTRFFGSGSRGVASMHGYLPEGFDAGH